MNVPWNAETFAALGNENRLQIVNWLRDPEAHFPTQTDGDLVVDGVCSGAIVRKLAISQPSVTAHMKILMAADLVTAKKIRQWMFYKLNKETIRAIEKQFSDIANE